MVVRWPLSAWLHSGGSCGLVGAKRLPGRAGVRAGSPFPARPSRAAATAAAMERFALTEKTSLVLKRGDLTKDDADAIVNAANQKMLGGGGVDGAIHRAAGKALYKACLEVPEVRPEVRCPTGEARITPGFNLPAKFVIHTVGPVYRNAEKSAPLLARCYQSSLALANQHKLRTIAFPAISCGVYGYPFHEAAAVALENCREHADNLEEVRFVLFDQGAWEAWLRAAQARLASSEPAELGAVASGAESDISSEGRSEPGTPSTPSNAALPLRGARLSESDEVKAAATAPTFPDGAAMKAQGISVANSGYESDTEEDREGTV
eukprot:jgi/Chlat1/3436/Chrsp23S03761